MGNGAVELDDIRAFVEVAEAGGFGRAGTRLGLSKSMVSRRVARLEAELGAQLLSRTTRGVAVTEAGVEFKEHAERVLAELDAARDALAQRGDEIVGSLRVAAPLSFGMSHLAPVLAELAVRHPKLQIDASYSDRYVDLIGERYDVAVRLGTLEDSSLVARRIAPIKVAVVASPAYLAAHGTPKGPEDLHDHNCLNFNFRRVEPVWPFVREGKEYSLSVKGNIEANNGETLGQLALAGVGVTRVGAFGVADDIAAGRLVPLLEDFNPGDVENIHAIFVGGANTPARVRVFVDFLAERLR